MPSLVEREELRDSWVTSQKFFSSLRKRYIILEIRPRWPFNCFWDWAGKSVPSQSPIKEFFYLRRNRPTLTSSKNCFSATEWAINWLLTWFHASLLPSVSDPKNLKIRRKNFCPKTEKCDQTLLPTICLTINHDIFRS